MKALILYRPNSEHARAVDEWLREFKTRSTGVIELIDVDSKEGAVTAELYDILQYPAVLAVSEDGQMLQRWPGEPLPLINDVVGYLAEH